MKLTKLQANEPVWLAIKEHLAERLDIERKKNDKPFLEDRDTQFLRGKIAVLKDLLALDTPEPTGGDE